MSVTNPGTDDWATLVNRGWTILCPTQDLPLVLTLTFSSTTLNTRSPLSIHGSGEIDLGAGSRVPFSEDTSWSNLSGLTVKVYSLDPSLSAVYNGVFLQDAVIAPAPVVFNSIVFGPYYEGQPGGLTALDLSGVTVANQIWFGNNQITTLQLGKNTGAHVWNLNNNKLATLDLSYQIDAEHISLYDNPLAALKLPNPNSNLLSLQVSSCGLSALSPSNYSSLNSLVCHDNNLTILDLSANTLLTQLTCSNNSISTIDVSGCTQLTLVNLDNNTLNQLAANALVAQLVANGATGGTLSMQGMNITNPGTGNWQTLQDPNGQNWTIYV
jgi:hypothetical protein